MKILVTGGLGHLGTCLAERLSRGYEVTVLDNCSNHLENYELSDAIRVLKGDIRDYDTVKKALKNTDFIIHAAAQIDVERSIRDPIFDADNNINGALNLLEAARKHNNIKKFIYFSSAAIYGMPTYIPIDEKHPTDPISPYGLSKLTGERYSLLYHKLYNLPVVCIRPFNIYSERQNPDNPYSGVISKFIKQIQLDQPLTIFGDGEQT
ncbi:epimerase, partial [Methanosarcinales archaeon]